MKEKVSFIITNLFTTMRLLGMFFLIPVFMCYGLYETMFLAALCFITDFVDGFLARKLNCSTFFGSLYDGVSDKLFLIVNLIILFYITPLTLIIVILELGIFIILTMKYRNNLNVKSNNFGKVKMWVAGITICLMYIFGSGNNIKNLLILLPLIIIEIITFISYVIEYKKEKNNINKTILNIKINKNMSLKYMLFNHEFYEKYKDDGNLRLLRGIAKREK